MGGCSHRIHLRKERPMNAIKYIGMDVHLATISIAVLDAGGNLRMEVTIATKAGALLDLIRGLSGTLHVTFEEGTSAHWLYTVLEPHVAKVLVCDPRQNPRRLGEKKSDRLDARKLAEWLRLGTLKPVYHGNSLGPALKELARSYRPLVSDTTGVMNRLKALYRARGIRCAGTRVYSPRFRDQWLEQWREPGARGRAERLHKQLDLLLPLRQEARSEMLAESRKHPAQKIPCSIPALGPVRVALLQTPYRFRGKRQLWTYAGLALVTRTSADYQMGIGGLLRGRWCMDGRVEKEFADQATHCVATAKRLGSKGRTVEINRRAARHRYVGASNRTPTVGT